MTANQLAGLLPGRSPETVRSKCMSMGIRCAPAGWSLSEDMVLQAYGPARSSRELAAMLPGRSAGAISGRLERLGIRRTPETISRLRIEGNRNRDGAWTDAEDVVLAGYGPYESAWELRQRLPGRSGDAIHARMRVLGIRRVARLGPEGSGATAEGRRMANRRWTEEELDIIRTYGMSMPLDDLSKLLPGRSSVCVRERARSMGISVPRARRRGRKRHGAVRPDTDQDISPAP